ncbi:MAG TPA: extracellular solute-binding protein [Acidimicrobiales bacterium]|nr:extracellular solute-binding protein [Acidimicrobiales bacterium]
MATDSPRPTRAYRHDALPQGPARLTSGFAIVALLSSMLSWTVTAKPAAAAPTVTVWAASGANYDWQTTLIPGFEETTGIHVTYEVVPETPLLDKEETAELARSTAYSVMEYSQAYTSTFAAEHGAAALTRFLTNRRLMPPSYDFGGISPGLYATCDLHGVLYCLPMSGDGGPMIFWNKRLFQAAAINSPPANWSQVLADAKRLTNPSAGVSGFCTRGSEDSNYYTFELMLPYFIQYSSTNRGEFLGQDWEPLFTTEGAKAWAFTYSTLMQKYAPYGVANYGYAECEHAFETGKTAMYFDDSVFEFFLNNPGISLTADVTGYDELPCPSFNQTCLVALPWGMYINPNLPIYQQDAAWQYLEYMTSPANQLRAMVATNAPGIASRVASLSYVLTHNSIFKAPTDWLNGNHYALDHIEPNAIPQTPAYAQIEEHLAVMLSSLISGQTTPAQTLRALQSQTAGILAQYGL